MTQVITYEEQIKHFCSLGYTEEEFHTLEKQVDDQVHMVYKIANKAYDMLPSDLKKIYKSFTALPIYALREILGRQPTKQCERDFYRVVASYWEEYYKLICLEDKFLCLRGIKSSPIRH